MTAITTANYYKLTNEDSRRINILKVWFTIMVVFIHSYSENINLSTGTINYEIPYWLEILKYIISQCISRCAVPGFFMISAILLYRTPFSWERNVKKKVRTLLVPYVLINSFWIVIYFMCQHVSGLRIYFSNESNIVANWEIMDWLQAYGLLGGYPITYPLWFIRDLFILNVLAVIIKRTVENLKWLSLPIMLFIWLFVRASWTQAVCFWGMGCFIVCYNIKLNVFDRIGKGFLCLIYFGTTVGDILTRLNRVNWPIHNLSIIAGILFWFACFTDFKTDRGNKILFFISSYSFSIYLFHEMTLSFLQKICARILPASPAVQLLEYLLIPVIIIMGILVISLALRRVCPRFYSIIIGNRTQ